MDDMIFGATNDSLYKDFSKLMQAASKISIIGELKFFLGLQIKQADEGIYIHQTKYVKELLKKFKLVDAKHIKTPMHPTTILGLNNESKKANEKTFRGMIGSLSYLTMSRPNIMFSLCLCARFQKEPREVNLFVVKHIFRYLNGTPSLGLCMKK